MKEKEIDAIKKDVAAKEKIVKDNEIERVKTQNEFTKKRIKYVYKFFWNNTDDCPVALMENFVACIMGRADSTAYDVELYLRSHEGLLTACKWVKTENVSRKNAVMYLDILDWWKLEIWEKKYSNFIPFYVWISNICNIVKANIELWTERFKLDEI